MSKDDAGKVMYSLIEPAFSNELAQVLTMGAQKYAPNNWKNTDNGLQRYYDALLRHVEAWRNGERFDEESGLSHLAHAAANIMFLHYLDKEEASRAEILIQEFFNAKDIPAQGKHYMGVAAPADKCDECRRADNEEEPRIELWLFRAD